MAVPFTAIAMTYNLWGRHRLDRRTEAIRTFLSSRSPDLLAVQELKPETRDLLDAVLGGHARVEDDFAGWSESSNLWWRRELFQLLDFGAEDIGIVSKHRRLFWARLLPLPLDNPTPLLFATAHYTWSGFGDESVSGINPRVNEARATVEALDRLAPDGPCLFVGDLNDEHHPARVLRGAGFHDCFWALGTHSPVTAPVVPLTLPPGDDNVPPRDIPRVIDYQFHRGPIQPRCVEVADYFLDGVAPSDHRPVIAAYTMGEHGR